MDKYYYLRKEKNKKELREFSCYVNQIYADPRKYFQIKD